MGQTHDRIFQCPTCEYNCGSVKSLRQHRLSIHENVRLFKCKSCEYSTYCLSKLNQHAKRVHENVKYQCEYCPFSTGYPQTLKNMCNACMKIASTYVNIVRLVLDIHTTLKGTTLSIIKV